MTQRDLNRAVARQTGETVRTIERLGFAIADPESELPDPEHEALGPYVLDWDRVDLQHAYDNAGLACC